MSTTPTLEPSTNKPDAPAERGAHRHRRRKRRFRGIPAPVVYYALLLLGIAALGLVYRQGVEYLPVAAVFGVLACIALVVNDRKGFIRRRQMRRAFEARRNFSNLEIVTLVGLIMANAFVALLRFLI